MTGAPSAGVQRACKRPASSPVLHVRNRKGLARTKVVAASSEVFYSQFFSWQHFRELCVVYYLERTLGSHAMDNNELER